MICIMLRFRKLVTEYEPEVQEVPQLFRSVLRACLDEARGDAELQAQNGRCDKARSKSLSFVTFRSKMRTVNRGRGSFGGSRGNLQEEPDWSDEEEEEADAGHAGTVARPRRGRSQSMPEIIPIEQAAQS